MNLLCNINVVVNLLNGLSSPGTIVLYNQHLRSFLKVRYWWK